MAFPDSSLCDRESSGMPPQDATPDGVVTTSWLGASGSLPAVIGPAAPSASLDVLTQWLREHRDVVEARIAESGAVLFRGFPIAAVEDFQAVTAAAADQLLEYSERSSPRSQISDRVYTSTDYPASQKIFPHNEHSYARTFPLRLFFGCLQPAQRGGETPLVDIRKVTARISAATRDRFREKGWMWVRNFGDGMGLSWQTTFQTTDRAVVEDYCRRASIDVEWKSGNRLRTRQVRPVLATHPRTGETLWFNHATFFHVSTLDPTMREVLLAEFGEHDLPNNTYYGDGTPIEPQVLDELRTAYERETVIFPWQRGDVVLLDNMLTAHARSSFAGPRKVLVAMAEPITRDDF